MTTNVIAISETTEFFLARGIPNVERDQTLGGVEWHWVHLDSKCCNVLLLKLSGQVPLDKGGLSDSTVSNKNEFEFSDCFWLRIHFFENFDFNYILLRILA